MHTIQQPSKTVHMKQSLRVLMQYMHAEDMHCTRQPVSVHLQKACGSSAQPYMEVRKAPLEGPCCPTELKYCIKACTPCSTVIIPEVEAEAAAAGTSAAAGADCETAAAGEAANDDMLGCKPAVAAAGEVDDMIDAEAESEGAAADTCWATTGGCSCEDACAGCNWEGGWAG